MLEDGAAVLEFLVKETLVRMNNGARLNEILHSVRAPADLIARPYLLPRYDDPEFVVRGIWHLYGGWYDGNPAHLKPAADHDLAGEIATLAGGAEALAARAEAAAQSGNLRLAAHLVEFAHMADQANARIHAHRAAIYGRVAQAETSLIGKALFAIAERESEKHIKDAD
jgi:alkyl sulfatase BDS1-like metallo-beta-lactamase superfamily hydrolase